MLKKLGPKTRLFVVIAVGIGYVRINSLLIACILALAGLVCFATNKQRNWKMALVPLFSGGMMFFYNVIFSPPEHSGLHWLIFTVNEGGIERGLVTGLRLMGTMFVSFAWLQATPLPEMYSGLAWIKPLEEWVLDTFRGLQIIRREFVILTQGLLIRGLKWNSVLANITNLAPLATLIIPRIIDNSQKATLATLAHKSLAPSGNGEVSCSGVWVRYSPELPDALMDINLNIRPGEIVYVAGKSKAGKTTLLRVLGGVISWVMGEYAGEVTVSGLMTKETSLAELSASVRYIAPDPLASIYGLTVGQEISFLAEDKEHARQVLSTMGLPNLWDKETTKLSGGQQVRLVLAGALASQAKILLLDSPLQELDPKGRQAFTEALQILRQQSDCTILVADPFWTEFRDYTDRVIVLEAGQLVDDLGSEEFFNDQRWLRRCNLSPYNSQLTLTRPGSLIAQLKNVHVTLEGNPILRGIDFSIRAGELVAITGPNGSGKTTAMLTLAGAIAPIRGKVERVGQDGVVFQNPALQVANMTVGQEIAFGPKILGWSQAKTDVFLYQGLQRTGLNSTTCPLDLHSADLQRLAIVANDTEVSLMVLDEPTIGLDSADISTVMCWIQEMLDNGTAVVIITHDQTIARQAHRVVVIDEGRVTYDGPPN